MTQHLYVIRDDVAEENISCFFSPNFQVVRRTMKDAYISGRKNGNPIPWLRDGFTLSEYYYSDEKKSYICSDVFFSCAQLLESFEKDYDELFGKKEEVK